MKLERLPTRNSAWLAMSGGVVHACLRDTGTCSHARAEADADAGTHVDRTRGEPHRVDADHRSDSRIQAAHSVAASDLTLTVPGHMDPVLARRGCVSC